jgi:fatty acid desaturase
MYQPCYRLPEAHRLLVEKGLTKRMEVKPGYLEVMRLATSRA